MAAPVTLPALLALFQIDRDLQMLRVGLENVQKDQKSQQARIARLCGELEKQEKNLKQQQAEIANRELEMKVRQEHIEKMRASLNAAKTNKEYSAILVQISAEKAEVAKMENTILEQMQSLETLDGAIKALKEQIGSEQAVLTRLETQHQDKVRDLERQIAELESHRSAAADNVPGEALRQYERVSQKYPGDAMAPLVYDEDDLDSISCGSCYMGLNVEHLNALRGRDAIRRCNSCNRILYLSDMLAQAK